MTSSTSATTLHPSSNDRITLLNQKESPFLRLPAELRNLIFNFVFREEVDPLAADVFQALLRSKYARVIGPAALLLVSRQMYAETNVLFFQVSIFDFRRICWRKPALTAKMIARCKTMESIMLGGSDLLEMNSGVWQKQMTHVKFGALRRVYLRTIWMGHRTLEDLFQDAFGKSNLEVVDMTRHFLKYEWPYREWAFEI